MVIQEGKENLAGAKPGSAAPRELVPSGFYGVTRRARDYLDDPGRASSLLTQAITKASSSKASLSEIWDDLMALIRLLRAWITGGYRDVPTNTMLLVTAAILYLVMPVDGVPDFVPALGFVDDVALILFVLKSIRLELESFLSWERSGEPRS